MADENDVTLEILRAVQNGLSAEEAVKLLHRIPAGAPAEAERPLTAAEQREQVGQRLLADIHAAQSRATVAIPTTDWL